MSENMPEEVPQPAKPVEQQSVENQSPEHQMPVDQAADHETRAMQESLPPPPIQEETPIVASSARSVRTFFIAIAGWIVPGLGHLFQGRIGRALAAFLAVGTMTLFGLWMRGNVFPPHGDDAFGVLGFLADAGSGVFYFLAHTIEKAGPDVSRAAGDYGTRLVATAGVLNLLFVLDAMEISSGRKT